VNRDKEEKISEKMGFLLFKKKRCEISELTCEFNICEGVRDASYIFNFNSPKGSEHKNKHTCWLYIVFKDASELKASFIQVGLSSKFTAL